MKKCPNCSKEISNQAIKCKHCGKLIDTQKGSNGIWNRYAGYIISIPIIIVCVAYIISSIANLTKSEDLAVQDNNPLIAEQSASQSPDANYEIARQSAIAPDIYNRQTSEQPAIKADDRKPSPNDEAYKPSSVADGKKKNQNQERLHEQQKRQLESLYR